MKIAAKAIGIFDSGVGGLTIVKELLHLLPQEELIYLGDTARFPYGDKSADTIVRYAVENSQFLCGKGIKLLVVACNTAAACALPKLQALLEIPVVGVIDPLVDEALKKTKGSLAILATHATIASQIFEQKIRAQRSDYQLYSVACPLFVPFVEERLSSHPAARLVAAHYLSPLRGKVDTALLACTHYPFLASMIQEEVGSEVLLIDSARSCAERVVDELSSRGWLNSHPSPQHRFFASDAPEKFGAFASCFLRIPLPAAELVKPQS